MRDADTNTGDERMLDCVHCDESFSSFAAIVTHHDETHQGERFDPTRYSDSIDWNDIEVSDVLNGVPDENDDVNAFLENVHSE